MQINQLRDLVREEPKNGIFRVHRSAFVAPEILELERERVFDRCWLYAGHESEAPNPGDFRTRNVGGRPIIIVRGSDGEVRVLINSCTHRGAQVCRHDEGNAKTFQCFYHAWTFNNQGELAGVPDAAGYGGDFSKDEMRLKSPARVENYRGLLFISFDSEIEDLVTYLAGAKEVLDVILDQAENGMEIAGGSHKYSLRANWKLLAENSIDGYHVRSLHATFVEYMDRVGIQSRGNIFPGTARSLGNGHGVMEYTAPWGRAVAKWEPRWGEETRGDFDELRKHLIDKWGEQRAMRIAENNRNLLIYPNLIVNDIMSVTVRTFYPLEPGYMDVNAWCLAPKGEDPRWRAMRLDAFLTFLGPGGLSTPDDVEALESCQRGYRAFREIEWSDMSRGLMRAPVMEDEEQMRGLWRKWNAQLRGGAPDRRRAVA
ncbi:MAG: aromatic ring-hydroxylating oxygenase subunit alpha [Candidatus Binataceae bacterium]